MQLFNRFIQLQEMQKKKMKLKALDSKMKHLRIFINNHQDKKESIKHLNNRIVINKQTLVQYQLIELKHLVEI